MLDTLADQHGLTGAQDYEDPAIIPLIRVRRKVVTGDFRHVRQRQRPLDAIEPPSLAKASQTAVFAVNPEHPSAFLEKTNCEQRR